MRKQSPQSIQVGQTGDTISLKASLNVTVFKEKPGVYVSYCPALDLSSYGSTPKEAEKMIADAVELFIADCHENRVLDEVLKDCGFRSFTELSKSRRKKPANAFPIDYPIVRQTIVPAELPMLAYGL